MLNNRFIARSAITEGAPKMTITATIIIILVLGAIIGGVFVLKKSAKKFNLTQEQLDKIKKRNEELDQQDSDI